MKSCSRYCEAITHLLIVPETCSRYSFDVVNRLWHLSSSLKYYHPHYQLGEGEIHDMADPDWLLQLHMALHEQQQRLELQQQQQHLLEDSQVPVVPTETPVDEYHHQSGVVQQDYSTPDVINSNNNAYQQDVPDHQQQQSNVDNVDIKTEVKEEPTNDNNLQQEFSFQPMLMPVVADQYQQQQQPLPPPLYGVGDGPTGVPNSAMDQQNNDYLKVVTMITSRLP